MCDLKMLVSGLNRSHLFLDATDCSTMAKYTQRLLSGFGTVLIRYGMKLLRRLSVLQVRHTTPLMRSYVRIPYVRFKLKRHSRQSGNE
jgi:hypothetical protein